LGKVWDIDNAKEFLHKLGYKLLGEEYKNKKTKIDIIDMEGYLYSVRLSDLLKEHIPNKFDRSNPYTIQNIKLWCNINNKLFELISNEYNGSDNLLQWKCLKDGCNEIFKMRWSALHYGQGCPYCRGMQVGITNCLATKRPDLAKEWHPTKNGELTPYNVTAGSGIKVWWQCDKGHEWETTISDRNLKNCGCPYCTGNFPSYDNNLLIINPKLCEEWNYDKNDKNPKEYTPNSNQKVWWICKQNHEWEATINSRNNGIGCPYCNGKRATKENNLLVNNHELCEEWDYSKNKKKPEDFTPKSSQKVWWICKECGFKWQALIGNRNKENSTGCPQCNESKGEKRIKEYLNFNNIDYIWQKEFDGLLGINDGLLSYDFYLSDYNLLIEYQGEQHEKYCKAFHKSKKDFEKQIEHDRRKKEYAQIHNIKLLEIWYFDYNNIEKILYKTIRKEENV